MDSVLADLISACITCAPEVLPHLPPKTREDWSRWDVWQDWGISKAEFVTLMNVAWERWEDMPLMEGGLADTVRRVGRRHTVHIVTSRHQDTHHYVVQWLQKHNIFYDNLTFLKADNKFDQAIDVLIDDNPTQSWRVPKGKCLFLRDQPWNQDVEEGVGVVRVRGVVDILDYLYAPWEDKVLR